MKKLLLIAMLLSLGTTYSAIAEEIKERPTNIGIEKFDTFKNESFDVYEKTYKLKLVVDSDKSLSAEQVAGLATLHKDIENLIKKGEQILKEGKNVNPKTKSLKAITNTKKSIEALNKAMEYIKYIQEKQAK